MYRPGNRDLAFDSSLASPDCDTWDSDSILFDNGTGADCDCDYDGRSEVSLSEVSVVVVKIYLVHIG